MDYADRPVLVTGGAGFIGSHLVEALVRRRARVTVVDNLSSGSSDNLDAVMSCLESHPLDITKDDLRPLLVKQKFDVIFHLAGHASISESVNHPRRDFEKNLVGTFNLLEAVRDVLPQTRILLASSAAVYGEGTGTPLLETDSIRPRSPYGAGKLATERYMEVYATLYGLRATSLRLFPVYGPRLRSLVVYDLMRKIVQNSQELLIDGDGTQVRDFVYVTDVADAFLTVGEKGHLSGEIYNVASGTTVSIRTLAQMLCKRMGVTPHIVYSGEVRPGISLRWSADISRVRALGYQPKMSLDEGLSATVSWFRKEMALAKVS